MWSLHAAYAWIAIHLLLRALAAFGFIAEPLAIHALTIGTIGGMTMGMMTRTAKGHSGRALALYALGYWGVLTQPRVDGKPG